MLTLTLRHPSRSLVLRKQPIASWDVALAYCGCGLVPSAAPYNTEQMIARAVFCRHPTGPAVRPDQLKAISRPSKLGTNRIVTPYDYHNFRGLDFGPRLTERAIASGILVDVDLGQRGLYLIIRHIGHPQSTPGSAPTLTSMVRD